MRDRNLGKEAFQARILTPKNAIESFAQAYFLCIAYANFIDITDDTIIKKQYDKASFSTYTKRERLAIEILEENLHTGHTERYESSALHR